MDHSRNERGALFLLLGLIIGAIGGVVGTAIKSRWGEGLASNAFFFGVLLLVGVVLARLLGVHPSRLRKPRGDGRTAV